MPTFDAGSASGRLILDMGSWRENINRAIADAAAVGNKLSALSDKSMATGRQFGMMGQAIVKFGEASQAGTTRATTGMDKFRASVKAADASILAMQHKAGRLGMPDVASGKVNLSGPSSGLGLAGAGLAQWKQEAQAAAQEVENVRERMFSLAGQAASTSTQVAGISNAAMIFSSVTNAGLLKVIANMVVMRREARLAASDIGKAQLAGNLGIAPTAGAMAASRAAAMPAAMSTVRGTAVGAVAAGAGILTLGVALKKTTSAAITFEDSFAGVKKTIDGTDEEFARLKTEILDMSTRIPVVATTLNSIAESAGQLGIAKENISKFVDTIAKVGVATNMTEDEAATAFAQWANITQMPQQSIDRLASTVVRLGNETASTESQIVGMGLRLAGAGKVVGLTDAQIAGLSATLASLGLQEEAAGTAFSTVMYEMASSVDMQNSKLKMFAALSGQSAKAFTDSFKNTPAKAIEDVVRGLEELRAAGGNVTQVLEALGLSDRRVRDAMIRISGSADFLKTNLGKAGDEWERNTALQDEAAKRFETTRSKAALLSNEMSLMAVNIGDVVLPAWNSFLGLLAKVPSAINTAVSSLGAYDQEMQRISSAVEEHLKKAHETGKLAPFEFKIDPKFNEPGWFEKLTGTNERLDRLNKHLAVMKGLAESVGEVNIDFLYAPPPDAVKVPLADPALYEMQHPKEEYVFGNKNAYDVLGNLRKDLDLVAGGTQNATDKAAELQKVFAEIGSDKTPEQIRKMAEDMNKAIPAESIKAGLQDIILAAEKGGLSQAAIVKNMADLWKSNKEGAGSLDGTLSKLTEIPEAYRAQFVAAAKAQDAADKASKSSLKSAKSAETEQKRLQDLGKQVYADLNQSAGAVDEVRKSLSGLAATGQITQENLARLAQTQWGDIAAFPLDEQQKAIAGIAAVNQGLGAQIALLRDRDSALGSDFYRGLKDGPDIVGDVLKNVDELKKSAVLHPDVYSLFGEGVWKQLTDLSGESLRGVYKQLDMLGKASPDMAGFVDKVRAGLDAGLEKVRADLGKEALLEWTPNVAVGIKIEADAINIEKALKAAASKPVQINAVPKFDAKTLIGSLVGAGSDIQQAVEKAMSQGDAGGSLLSGIFGNTDDAKKGLVSAVQDVVEYAREHFFDIGAKSVLTPSNIQNIMGLSVPDFTAEIDGIAKRIDDLYAGLAQPPNGQELDSYIQRLEEIYGQYTIILGLKKLLGESPEKGKSQRKTDEENFGKSSSDLKGWAGAAEDITTIGQGLGQLGPKFAKVQKAATVAGDAIKLAMAVASGDGVSMAINGIGLVADAMGLASNKAEEMKTGMDRVFEEIGNSIDGWVDQFTDAIVEFVKTGKGSFKELVDSMLEDILKMVMKYAIIQPMLHSFGVPNSVFNAKGNAFEGGNILPFAKGAAFAMPDMPKPYVPVPNIVPFAQGGAFAAGTVVNKATAFNMGVMGEAGPEAIMPLKRTADGSLGVRAIGGAAGVGGARIVVNNIDQSTRITEAQTETQMSTGSDGIITITNIMRDAVKRSLADGSLDRDMASNFGIKRRAR